MIFTSIINVILILWVFWFFWLWRWYCQLKYKMWRVLYNCNRFNSCRLKQSQSLWTYLHAYQTFVHFILNSSVAFIKGCVHESDFWFNDILKRESCFRMVSELYLLMSVPNFDISLWHYKARWLDSILRNSNSR